MSPRLVASAFALAALATPMSSFADMSKAQCVKANADAQSLRQDGKLAAARDLLKTCTDPKCPALVVTDCTKRLDEIEATQPTIVFDVKDGNGNDLSTVKVSVDNTPLAERLDGSALRVDPGSHVFTFEVAGQAPITQTLVLKEGEKDRHEKIVIGTPTPTPAPAPASVEPDVPPSPPPSSGWTTMRTVGVVMGGAGVAAVAVGSIFGLMASSAWSSSQNECASPTTCTNRPQAVSDHDAGVTDATISTIGFIAGGALAAGGVALFFMGARPSSETAQRQSGVVVAPAVAPGLASLSVRGSF